MDIISEIKKEEFIESFLESLVLDGKSANYINKAHEILTTFTSDYKWSMPRKAGIPKEGGGVREVFIFKDEDSIILKAINKYLNSAFNHLLSDRVFSYKTGINTRIAVNDLLLKQEGNTTVNYIKTDISQYFNMVSKKAIHEALDTLFTDKDSNKLMKNLYAIDSYYVLNSNSEKEVIKEYMGLLPGTAISAFMSNYVLRKIDNFLYNNCKYYIRYSDDILIADPSMKNLMAIFTKLRNRLKKMGLYINDKKTTYVENARSLTYLGLKVDLSSSTVDISDKNYSKISNSIKLIAKKYRKDYELARKQLRNESINHYISKAIDDINKRLYLGVIANGIHKNSSLIYLFNTINTTSTLKRLEYYIVDRLRYVKTGKNNKGNIKAISVKDLEDLGYKSCIQMYNLFHLNSDLFNSEAAMLLNKDNIKSLPIGYLKEIDFNTIELCKMDLETFITNSKLINSYVVCNNAVYNVNSIRVDFKNNKIVLDNLDLFYIKDGELVQTDVDLYCLNNNNLYKFNSNGRLVTNKDTEGIIHKYYINTCSNLPVIKFEGGYNPYKSFYSLDIYNFYLNEFKYEEKYNNPLIFAIKLLQYKIDNINSIDKEYIVIGKKDKFNLAVKAI